MQRKIYLQYFQFNTRVTEIKTKYLNESTLNMDNIVNDSMLIYNMLEMVSTTNMVNVNEEYMRNYVKSLA